MWTASHSSEDLSEIRTQVDFLDTLFISRYDGDNSDIFHYYLCG